MRVAAVLLTGVVMLATYVGSPAGAFVPTGATWTRSASNPIITPTVAWESTAVAEVGGFVDHGSYLTGFYSAGWGSPGLGRFTTTDGITVTKDAGNPVLGQGGSGLAGNIASPRVFLHAGVLHLYASSGSPLRSTTVHYTSTDDGETWSSASLSISLASGCTLWGNAEVWIEGSTWYRLQDEFHSTFWQVYLYTSSDGNTWSIANSGSPLSTLQVHAGDTYGGMRFALINGAITPKVGSVYELWFHAASAGATLPTDLYHATSSSFPGTPDSWTISPATPILTHLGTGFEIDQMAGPVPVLWKDQSFLYYDGDDNTHSAASIGVALGS